MYLSASSLSCLTTMIKYSLYSSKVAQLNTRVEIGGYIYIPMHLPPLMPLPMQCTAHSLLHIAMGNFFFVSTP